MKNNNTIFFGFLFFILGFIFIFSNETLADDYNKEDNELTENVKPLPPIVTPSNEPGSIKLLMEKFTISPKLKKKLQREALKEYKKKNAKIEVFYSYKINKISDSDSNTFVNENNEVVDINSLSKKTDNAIEGIFKKNKAVVSNIPPGGYNLSYSVFLGTKVKNKTHKLISSVASFNKTQKLTTENTTNNINPLKNKENVVKKTIKKAKSNVVEKTLPNGRYKIKYKIMEPTIFTNKKIILWTKKTTFLAPRKSQESDSTYFTINKYKYKTITIVPKNNKQNGITFILDKK